MINTILTYKVSYETTMFIVILFFIVNSGYITLNYLAQNTGFSVMSPFLSKYLQRLKRKDRNRIQIGEIVQTRRKK